MNEIINWFNKIRRVNYEIVDIEYSLENSYNLIENNIASCSPKHFVLSEEFRKLGFDTRFCVHEFSWTDLNHYFPIHLKTLSKKIKNDFHTNLEIRVHNKWILVDATWDDYLLDLGFSGSKNWDGINSTENCVKSIKEWKFDSWNQRIKFLESQKINSINDIKLLDEFINELNVFFKSLRT